MYISYSLYIHQIKLFIFNDYVKFTPKIEKNMEKTLNIDIFQNALNTLLETQIFKIILEFDILLGVGYTKSKKLISMSLGLKFE